MFTSNDTSLSIDSSGGYLFFEAQTRRRWGSRHGRFEGVGSNRRWWWQRRFKIVLSCIGMHVSTVAMAAVDPHTHPIRSQSSCYCLNFTMASHLRYVYSNRLRVRARCCIINGNPGWRLFVTVDARHIQCASSNRDIAAPSLTISYIELMISIYYFQSRTSDAACPNHLSVFSPHNKKNAFRILDQDDPPKKDKKKRSDPTSQVGRVLVT